VAVLTAGAPVEMPWIGRCRALLHGYLHGQAGASAIADILVGVANPCGKLAETYPLKLADTPAYSYYPGREKTSEYRESIFVGYRYYDAVGQAVRFPFGYGLSYTTFEYKNISIDKVMGSVSFTMKNTGSVGGAEIAQLYISLRNSEVFRASKELKGFAKVFLSPGEEQTLAIPLDDKAFRFFNPHSNKWETETGVYTVMVGANARDIKLRATVEIDGVSAVNIYEKRELKSYFNAQVKNVSDDEYRVLLGRKIPASKWDDTLSINDTFGQLYYAKSLLGRLFIRALDCIKRRSQKKGKYDLNILFIYDMPFRAIAKLTGGMVSMEMVTGIVELFNGHFIKGIRIIVVGFFRNRKANKAGGCC
jgi:beta-glucosidase